MMFSDFYAFAPAKVNLTLHIKGKRADGYHELSSLVMFADVGDRVWGRADSFAAAKKTVLEVRGPFAHALTSGGSANDRNGGAENHILVMEQLWRTFFGGAPVVSQFRLEKNLPVASGLGGGSADAAAALRCLLASVEDTPEAVNMVAHAQDLQHLMLQVGADVPVCFYAQTCLMQGLGETITPLDDGLRLFAILVNPGVGVSTATIFRHLAAQSLPLSSKSYQKEKQQDVQVAMAIEDGEALLDYIRAGRNDLQPAAVKALPLIGTLLEEISRLPNCLLTRMSGSGATCFGVFPTLELAKAGAAQLLQKYPDWWCCPVTLGKPLADMKAE